MAFTNLSLNTQQLLESTFISDMRLIINANTAVLRGKTEDIVNTLEIDLVNKYIGVDNFLGQVKTDLSIVGTALRLMDGTNVIASLTKSTGLSTFTVNNVVISAGGTIDASTTGTKIAIKQLGVGINLADINADGLYVGNTATSVPASFYGEVTFAKQAVTHSTEGTINTSVNLLSGSTTGIGPIFYGELKLTKTSKQFIYVSLTLPVGATPSSATPIYVLLYEDSASSPNPGQTFTVVIKGLYSSTGTAVNQADWGYVYLVSGYDLATSGKYPGVLNGGLEPTQTTYDAAIDDLANSSLQYINFYNGNIMLNYGGGASQLYGASINLTKYENTSTVSSSWARYVVTGSHNIQVIN